MDVDSPTEKGTSLAPSKGYPLSSDQFCRSRNLRDAADPNGPGRLNWHGWAASRCLQRLATGRETGRRTRPQPQMREDLLDHQLLQDGRNDLQLAAETRAVFHRWDVHRFTARALQLEDPEAAARDVRQPAITGPW